MGKINNKGRKVQKGGFPDAGRKAAGKFLKTLKGSIGTGATALGGKSVLTGLTALPSKEAWKRGSEKLKNNIIPSLPEDRVWTSTGSKFAKEAIWEALWEEPCWIDPEDKSFLSRAYVVLGELYRAVQGREQEALVAYLTVDLVYNVAPESHAEALFYLSNLWAVARQEERSRQAGQILKEAYPQSEWAKKLTQKEKKS